MLDMKNGSWIALTTSFVAVAAVFVYFTRKKYGIFKCFFEKKKITLIDPEAKYPLPLIEKKVVSPNTAIFRFQLPSEEHSLGLPIGQHVHLIAQINGKLTIRPYTPISSEDDKGFVEMLIKIYRANEHPKFPAGGKMTQYIDSLKIGDTIDFRGPSGLIVYKGHGQFETRKKKSDTPVRRTYKNLGMIAGGSGITPMLQIVRAILKDKTDSTTISLLFANQSEEDILLRDELDELVTQHPKQFHVWYTVDRPPFEWAYSTGFINSEMIENHFPSPSGDVGVLMCGPAPMINFACNPSLDKVGYASENRMIF